MRWSIGYCFAFWLPKKTYTVFFDANGGRGEPASQTKYHDEALTLSSVVPTRSGYTFLGWGTSAGDTSVNYAPGGTYTKNEEDVLYAIWECNHTTTTVVNAKEKEGIVIGTSAGKHNSKSPFSFWPAAIKRIAEATHSGFSKP